jgi:hypothetical protein
MGHAHSAHRPAWSGRWRAGSRAATADVATAASYVVRDVHSAMRGDAIPGDTRSDNSADSSSLGTRALSMTLGLSRISSDSNARARPRADPARELERLEGTRTKEPRALTTEEQAQWLLGMTQDRVAVRRDSVDFSAFLLARGLRIGEALAVARGRCRGGSAHGHLDPHPCDGSRPFRDPRNVSGNMADIRDRLGFAWVTSHSWRKTMATILDGGGASPRMIADQLGHSWVSMSLDVYLGRRSMDARVLAALESVDPGKLNSQSDGQSGGSPHHDDRT